MGQCLEITATFQAVIGELDHEQLTPTLQRGYQAIRAFHAAGSAFRHIWGDLRGQYFQNAFRLGTLYVDIANDTVNPLKLKVEIVPFDQAQIYRVRHYDHYRKRGRVSSEPASVSTGSSLANVYCTTNMAPPT